MSGFNLPPGVTILPGDGITWEEVFEASSEFEGLPIEAKRRWRNAGVPLSKLFGAIMGWAWAAGAADGNMGTAEWLDVHAIPQAAAALGLDSEALHEALYNKAPPAMPEPDERETFDTKWAPSYR